MKRTERTLSSSFISSFVLFFVVSWMKRRETEGNTRSPFTACFPSFHFSSFHSIHHTITPDKLNEEWTKEDNEERTQVSEVSAWFLFISSFRSSLHCWLCALFFFLSLMLQFTAYFGSLVIEAWIKKEEEQRTQHQTQSCYLLFFALSFVFLSLQWFVMKARNHVKRKRNTKHKGKHHVLCFFLLSTNSRFISSLRSSFHCNWWKGRKEQRGVVEKDPKEPNGTQR